MTLELPDYSYINRAGHGLFELVAYAQTNLCFLIVKTEYG